MSTPLKTNEKSKKNSMPIKNTSFFGGVERGKCFQMHTMTPFGDTDCISMTKSQVKEQIKIMQEWLDNF